MKLMAEGIRRDFFRSGKNTNIFTAVQKTDFTLLEGCMTVIVGRSGSGKTTFIQMLSGLLTPTEGKVTADNTDLYLLSDKERSAFRNRHIGIIPQGQTGLQRFTVLENVLLPVEMYGKADDKKDKALQLLEAVEIGALADVYAGELSGGELRRMAIVRAMIHEPQILIADEPTGNIDPERSFEIMKMLSAINKKGTTVLIVTHEHELVKAFGGRILKIADGAITSDSFLPTEYHPAQASNGKEVSP